VTSLRAKIALLLVVAIVSVVGLATAAAVWVIGPPDPVRSLLPQADQIHFIAEMAEAQLAAGRPLPLGRDVRLAPAPPAGPRSERLTAELARALATTGPQVAVIATQPADGSDALVSIPLGSHGWLTIPLAGPAPPRGGWLILIGWMSLIVLGVTAVALVVASRMTRPLSVLEGAVAAVGPDGLPPALPETGPAEVRATARALNRLSALARAAMDKRMRLLAAAGHDLRTPITRMRLRAEFLPDDDRLQWLSDVDELERIAESAITLVREEAGSSVAEPVELGQLVREIADELADQGHDVVVAATVPVPVRGARLGLTRALRNLMVNAATHGGGAWVAVERRDGTGVVTIEDGGPGIPAALIERVFEPFFRVDPARRHAMPGAGLGLAIAKEIVERQGGTLAIENRPEGGLRQTLTLPASAGDA